MLRDRSAFHDGINSYVPAMAYGSAAIHGVPMRVSLGIPATAAATAVATLLNAQATINTNTYFTTPITMDGTYGRNVTYTPSGVPGNANVVEVFGYDYMGQPMVERITGASGASTLIAGLKAFKKVIGWRTITASTNAITFSLGSGLTLGLPFKGEIVTAKEGTTNMTFAQINTNRVVPVLTDPQTATTGDPRGTYTPTTAPNGALAYELGVIGDPTVNAAGNGGLCGIRHFAF